MPNPTLTPDQYHKLRQWQGIYVACRITEHGTANATNDKHLSPFPDLHLVDILTHIWYVKTDFSSN